MTDHTDAGRAFITVTIKPYTVERDGLWYPALEIRQSGLLPELTYEHSNIACETKGAADLLAGLWAWEQRGKMERQFENALAWIRSQRTGQPGGD